MEIDDKLKNRLAGTAVVTVLAIIFLPMLFDSPAEKKAQVVSELDIPRKPEVSPLLNTAIVPDKTAEVVTKPKPAEPSLGKNSESLIDKTEKNEPDSGLENSLQDTEAAAQEDEAAESAKKKSHKKTEELQVVASTEEKLEKPVKKTSKLELPSLAENETNKKEIGKELPNLDSNPAAEKHRWVIQVASLTDQAKANAFRDKLRSQGFPATVDSVWLKGKGRVYRLKVGPELDAEKAKSMKNKINQLNNVNSIAIAE